MSKETKAMTEFPAPDISIIISTPIHLATDQESESHYSLRYSQLTACEDGSLFASASNGRMACIVPVTGAAPTGQHHIPWEVLPKEKGDFAHSIARVCGRWFHRCRGWATGETELRFPRMQDALPVRTEESTTLVLNPWLLLRAAQAIGCDEFVTLILPPPEHGYIDHCIGLAADEADGIGAIMPVNPDRNRSEAYESMRMRICKSMPAPRPQPVPFDRALLGC